MKVQLLIATTNQKDYSLLDKMKVCTDAIVANQCQENSVKEFIYKGNKIKWLSFNEKGVGLNRNNALMRASGDICLFSDDDMEYVDGYETLVKQAFLQNKKADVLIFNLIESDKKRHINTKVKKVNWFNFLRYGTARIAIRLKSVKLEGIYFNECFGGGTEYSHGEDSIFLASCLKNKLKIYTSPIFIAKLTDERPSTWEVGYTDKYLKDQGVLYKRISKRFWKFLCLQDAIRHCKQYKKSAYYCYKIMVSK